MGDNLYFMNKGDVSVSISTEKKDKDDSTDGGRDSQVIAVLKDGSIFGEIALLTKLKRTATVTADDISNCAYLNRQDVEKMEANFPHISKSFRNKI